VNKRFARRPTTIPGLTAVERQPVGDHRGFLERLFDADELQSLIGDATIVQINRTLTVTRGTVRGMHYQRPPHAEIKLVTCLRGSVFDVAVDVRQNSPTFLRWHAETLSAEHPVSLIVPEGFAHGFQTLTDDCELLYFHTARYAPDAEGALNPRDSRLAIAWPLPIAEMSARDESHPMLTADFTGVAL
jgi:dTDP-4-dehydrorhamnose 3,5-epimerase